MEIERNVKIISPLAVRAFTTTNDGAIQPLFSEHDKIVNEIKLVFGSYSDKAFQLLTSPVCHENGKLNPQAVNDNTSWGGVGKDYGIFQINDKWQGVSNTNFLTDWHINIRMAWNIFQRSGYSFKMWSCGKVLHI